VILVVATLVRGSRKGDSDKVCGGPMAFAPNTVNDTADKVNADSLERVCRTFQVFLEASE